MELLRIGPRGSERPVARADGVDYDLTPLCDDIDGAFLADSGVDRARDALEGSALPRHESGPEARVGAPVARPQAVVCIGQNYAEHAAEMGAEPPVEPVIFFKHPNTVVGPYDDVLLPPGATSVDWEAELAIVVGTQARYLDSPEVAAAHIAGYCVANDVSERTYQFDRSGGQWSKGKCCDTFNPLGPFLVSVDAVADVDSLRIWSTVNGEPRQESSTADMIFSPLYLVWHLSQYLVLEPGDVINTGTPPGVGLSGRFPYLREGDVYEGGIDGLGTQRQRMRSTDPATGPRHQ